MSVRGYGSSGQGRGGESARRRDETRRGGSAAENVLGAGAKGGKNGTSGVRRRQSKGKC